MPDRRARRACPRRRDRPRLEEARHHGGRRPVAADRHRRRASAHLRRTAQRRPLLGLPRRRRPELRDRHRLPAARLAGRQRLLLLRHLAVVIRSDDHPRLAALGAERGRRADDAVPAVDRRDRPDAPDLRPVPRPREASGGAARAADEGLAADPLLERHVRLPRPDAALGRLSRAVDGRLPSRRRARHARARDVRRKVGLREEALLGRRRADAPARPRDAPDLRSRLGRGDHGFLRRRDRPRRPGRDRLRPPQAAPLDAVLRLPGALRSTRRRRWPGFALCTPRCARPSPAART